MNFADYKDIYEFYRRTGMTRDQAADFLLNELTKEVTQHEKQKQKKPNVDEP